MGKLAIIIANWNGRKVLEDCLKSLSNQTSGDFRIILVDNGSEDDSVSFTKENYPAVEVIALFGNTGFAKANNIGISKAFESEEIKYVIALNNDTKVSSDFVERMVEGAKNHPGFGSIQPKVVSYDGKRIDSAGILIYKDMSARSRGYEEGSDKYNKEEEIFGASACATIYSREALEKVKLPNDNYFDEDYFAYNEDVDLVWRLRLSGFKSFYCPKATVFHIHSATGKKYSYFERFYLHRNQYYNIIKDLPLWMMVKALIFMPVRYLMLLNSILKKKGPSAELAKGKQASIIKLVLNAWKDVIVNLAKLIKKRKYIQKTKSVSNDEVKEWFKLYKADIRKIIYG